MHMPRPGVRKEEFHDQLGKGDEQRSIRRPVENMLARGREPLAVECTQQSQSSVDGIEFDFEPVDFQSK